MASGGPERLCTAEMRVGEDPPALMQGGVVVIGNFDGVHLGHQALVAHAREIADRLGAPAIALTFTPHPFRYFRIPFTPLTSDEEKARLLQRSGATAVLFVAFEAALANMPGARFVESFLLKSLKARHIVVGHDFRFGRDRLDVEDLSRLALEERCATTILAPVKLGEERISSTLARKAVKEGDRKRALALLGRHA